MATIPTIAYSCTVVVASTPIVIQSKLEPSEVKVFEARLIEIKSIDKSGLNKVQKNELKREVKDIKKTLAINGGGVYLSAGAIIVIILLLIILL